MAKYYRCDICKREVQESGIITNDEWASVTIEPILCQRDNNIRTYDLCPLCRHRLIKGLEEKTFGFTGGKE